MSGIDVDVSEVRALAIELEKAGPAAEKVASASMTKLAAQVRDEASRDAPRQTGDLAASYKIAGGKDYRIIYSDLRYAGFVEHGTGDTAPQPHLWPAGRRAERDLFEALRKIDPLP